MPFECISVRREGAIEHVVLNRPAVRNAFNEHAIRELTWWADSAAKDRTLRLAILSGAGPVFCAGADVTWMSRMIGYTQQENIEVLAARIQELEDRVDEQTAATKEA